MSPMYYVRPQSRDEIEKNIEINRDDFLEKSQPSSTSAGPCRLEEVQEVAHVQHGTEADRNASKHEIIKKHDLQSKDLHDSEAVSVESNDSSFRSFVEDGLGDIVSAEKERPTSENGRQSVNEMERKTSNQVLPAKAKARGKPGKPGKSGKPKAKAIEKVITWKKSAQSAQPITLKANNLAQNFDETANSVSQETTLRPKTTSSANATAPSHAIVPAKKRSGNSTEEKFRKFSYYRRKTAAPHTHAYLIGRRLNAAFCGRLRARVSSRIPDDTSEHRGRQNRWRNGRKTSHNARETFA